MNVPAHDPPHSAHRRRAIIRAAKVGIAVAIFAALFYRVRGEGMVTRLVEEPKHWGMLAIGQALVMLALFLNYIRWWVLVRALELDFHIRDAVRLGALGTMLNQVSPGSVGGDLFKAVAIAHEQPTKRTEAVASVVIDRVVGLYAMLLLATGGYLIGARRGEFTSALDALAGVVMALAAAGTVGLALLMTPAFTGPAVRRLAERLPLVGGTVARLIDAAAAYRARRRYLFAGIIIACCTHALLVASLWSIGQGLPVNAPSLANTFVVGPTCLAAGAIPLTPSGLGVFEGAMDQIYANVGAREGDGLLVAITYRLATYVMAAVGTVYYLSARRQMAEVMHEAEEIADEQG